MVVSAGCLSTGLIAVAVVVSTGCFSMGLMAVAVTKSLTVVLVVGTVGLSPITGIVTDVLDAFSVEDRAVVDVIGNVTVKVLFSELFDIVCVVVDVIGTRVSVALSAVAFGTVVVVIGKVDVVGTVVVIFNVVVDDDGIVIVV